MIVGGSWQWSPASTIRSARKSGIQQAGSVAWAASSITTRSNCRSPSSWAIEAGQRGTQHAGRIEQMLDHLLLDAAGVGDQLAGLAAHACLRPRRRLGPGEAVGFAKESAGLLLQLAGQDDVGMGIDEQIERVRLQFRQHAGRMPQPHRPLAGPHQPLQQVIDRQVARRRPAPSRREQSPAGSTRQPSASCRSLAGHE